MWKLPAYLASSFHINFFYLSVFLCRYLDALQKVLCFHPKSTHYLPWAIRGANLRQRRNNTVFVMENRKTRLTPSMCSLNYSVCLYHSFELMTILNAHTISLQNAMQNSLHHTLINTLIIIDIKKVKNRTKQYIYLKHLFNYGVFIKMYFNQF